MTALLAWIKKYAAGIGGLILVVLVPAFGGWLWRRERRKRLEAEARAEVNRLREKIATAKAVRKTFLADAAGHDESIRQLDESIESNERAILSAHEEPLEELSRDEIRERLRRLGY